MFESYLASLARGTCDGSMYCEFCPLIEAMKRCGRVLPCGTATARKDSAAKARKILSVPEYNA